MNLNSEGVRQHAFLYSWNYRILTIAIENILSESPLSTIIKWKV
jgi:hypothetical protein